MREMTVFFSNQVEQLYQRLKELSFPSSPFAKRWLVVPNPAVKSWLMLQLARDPDVGIAAGFEVLYLTQAVERLKQIIKPSEKSKQLPSSLEMKLAIEVEIKKIILSYPTLSDAEQQIWDPLLAYLKIRDGGRLSRRGERRLVALAEKLAGLFSNYGIYGARMVAAALEKFV
jgi:exodeoxyribonuclease V gamma subunit